jgi:hypothetical protein
MSLTWRLYWDDGLIKLFHFAVIAKIAPYRLATGTLSLLATGTIGRMASPVTQTPSIAVPLGVTNVPTIYLINKEFLSLTHESYRKEY